MERMAAELVRAQRGKNPSMESAILKQIADATKPIRKVNAASASGMPGRFLEKVVFGASGCWTWRGHVDAIGYGRFPHLGENKAHRVSHALFKGPIAAEMLVLHKCDNRQCVNPDHLFLGTQRDNMRDMISKGRGYSPSLTGAKNPMAKLTWEKTAEIRSMVEAGATQRAASLRFGVSAMTVSRIIRKESWI